MRWVCVVLVGLLAAPMAVADGHEAVEARQAFGAAMLPGGDVLSVWLDGDTIMRGRYDAAQDRWQSPEVAVDGVAATGLAVLWHAPSEQHVLLTGLDTTNAEQAAVRRIEVRKSGDQGISWSAPVVVHEAPVAPDSSMPYISSAVVTSANELAAVFLTTASPGGISYGLLNSSDGDVWNVAEFDGGAFGHLPVLVPDAEKGVQIFSLVSAGNRWQRKLWSGGGWSGNGLVNLASAGSILPVPGTLATVRATTGELFAVANDNVIAPGELSARISHDNGRTWPDRRVLATDAAAASPVLLRGEDDTFHVVYRGEDGDIKHTGFDTNWIVAPTRLRVEPTLAAVAPPSESRSHSNALRVPGDPPALPIADTPFMEHVGVAATEADWEEVKPASPEQNLPGVFAVVSTPVVRQGEMGWVGTEDGLYYQASEGRAFQRHRSYGVDGPLSNRIAGLAVDSKGVLWVASPAGLSSRDGDGAWTEIRGRQGLPWEELTAIAVDGQDRLWLGSTRGLIVYRPYGEGRQWYYRITQRYVPDDHIQALVLEENGVIVQTPKGPGRVQEVERTMFSKAEYIENRLNERHRHLGIPSPAHYKDDALIEWSFGSQASDGLWTGYHVAAMSMAYSLTGEERYKQSAKVGMETLYKFQNITGVTGLVARSVVEVNTPAWEPIKDMENWHLTEDGQYMWRDDVSSDQIDGHYLAFYTYYEHIAQYDADERARLEAQLRQTTDYLINNNYQIIDWHGERTLWGWWNPELLNDKPEHYLESGLYSLMMLSFLKVTHYVTDDDVYMDHYRKLSEEHGYVSNMLLQKKVEPDSVNHSDDQLSAVAFYPFIQLEYSPYVRDALLRSLRRHALIEIPERNSFMAFVYAAMDPEDADVAGGVRSLREIPQDRRNWGVDNGPRADVALAPGSSRQNRPYLTEVVPYDERFFHRWNQNPYEAKAGGDGMTEDAGVHYLLPYWMGRYHGLIAAP
jgi:hypothetical protein